MIRDNNVVSVKKAEVWDEYIIETQNWWLFLRRCILPLWDSMSNCPSKPVPEIDYACCCDVLQQTFLEKEEKRRENEQTPSPPPKQKNVKQTTQRCLSFCGQAAGSLQQTQPYSQFYNMQGAYYGGAYPNTYSTVGAAAAQQQYLQAGNMGQWQPTYPANYQPYG